MTADRVGQLLEQLFDGQQIALSRLISMVENEPARMAVILPTIHHRLGRAFCVGLTGPPGAGKSTLVNQVAKLLRKEGKKVGIIAVDPTSPFSGGALLGDRVRMQDLYLDPGVFIRSMATRGSLGGLSRATRNAIKLMDAFGMDYVLVETVGVGQTELDVMQATDITAVILVPEGGDSIQAMKAGLMEIGDIFVINKSDRPGADNMETQLKMVLHMNPRFDSKGPSVVLTQGKNGTGVEELVDVIIRKKSELENEGLQSSRKKKAATEFEDILKYIVVRGWKRLLYNDAEVKQHYAEVIAGNKDPYTAIKELFPGGLIKKPIINEVRS
jgi:GTPase